MSNEYGDFFNENQTDTLFGNYTLINIIKNNTSFTGEFLIKPKILYQKIVKNAERYSKWMNGYYCYI